jgi:hypothetical protein
MNSKSTKNKKKSKESNVKWTKLMDEEHSKPYYHNSVTGESSWLPPCCVCDCISLKWCVDCDSAYCSLDFDSKHRIETHIWSFNESHREALNDGEVYCVSCNVKVAKKYCLTCFDPYCKDCLYSIHCVGALKFHKFCSYKRATFNWIVIRKTNSLEVEYYLKLSTGEKSFSKPEEVMNDEEIVMLKNFKSHKTAAEEYVKTIENLQYELEATKYERDKLLTEVYSYRNSKSNATAVINNTINNNEKSSLKNNRPKGGDVLASLFSSKESNINAAANSLNYKTLLLTPSDRRRGQSKTEEIKKLIDG